MRIKLKASLRIEGIWRHGKKVFAMAVMLDFDRLLEKELQRKRAVIAEILVIAPPTAEIFTKFKGANLGAARLKSAQKFICNQDMVQMRWPAGI